MRAAKFLLLFISFAALSSATARAEDRTPTLLRTDKGDTTHLIVGGEGSLTLVLADVIDLSRKPASEDDAVIDQLTKDRNHLPPPYLYELARRTFSRDREKALYWYNLGGLRMRYDVMRCQDASADRGLSIVERALAPLTQQVAIFAEEDHGKVASSLRSLRSRDEIFDSQASPWWICSQGRQAGDAAVKGVMLKSDEWLKPENEWWSLKQAVNDILDVNIADYLGR